MRPLAFLPALLLALLCALAVSAAPVSAEGAGTSTSAGDQQYVDPLTSTTPQPSHPHHTSTSQGTSARPNASSSSGSGTLSHTPPGSFGNSSTGASSSQAVSGTSSAPNSSRMLPLTGLNAWACAAAGLALLGSGLALRLIARRA